MTRTRKSYKKAVLWAQVMTWGDRGFTALFAIVLASLLGPESFGLMAIALAFVLFMQMLLEQGIPAAIIQRPDLEEDHLHSTFLLTLGLSIALGGAAALLAGWWGAVNDAPQLSLVIQVLAITLPINGLTVVQQASLQRDMDFRSLAVRAVVSVLIGGAVGIWCAFEGMGVWALVVQTITRSIVALALLWQLSAYRPRFRISPRHLREITSFSGVVFIDAIGVYLNRHAYAMAMGIFFGPIAAGAYALTSKIRDLGTVVATRPLAIVALPEFSRYQDDPDMLRKRFRRMVRLSSLLTLPLIAGLASLSRPIIDLLGDKWTDLAAATALTLALLSATVATAPLSIFATSVMRAVGRPFQAAKLNWFGSGCTLVAFLVAGPLLADGPVGDQIVGCALAQLAMSLFVMLPAQLWCIKRTIDLSPSGIFDQVWPVALASVGAGAAAWFVVSTPTVGGLHPLVTLALGSVAFGAVIFPLAAIFDRSLRADIRAFREGLTDGGPAEPEPAERAPGREALS